MNNKFEKIIAEHCSPTLVGLKPASLVSMTKDEFMEWELSIEEFNLLFRNQGFKIDILCLCKKRILLFLYHKESMEMWIGKEEVRELLYSVGYPLSLSTAELVEHLAKRIYEMNDFPHEIGAILGYPIEDVKGFMKNKGKNYKVSGYWKVYGDIETSEKLFQQYRICKEVFSNALLSGMTLKELLSAA